MHNRAEPAVRLSRRPPKVKSRWAILLPEHRQAAERDVYY